MVEISREVPFPGRASRLGAPTKYPWREMAPGDSFPVDLHNLSNVRVCAKGYGDRNGGEFIVARVPGTNEYRCWRVS